MSEFHWKLIGKDGFPVQAVDQASASLVEPDFFRPQGVIEAGSLDDAMEIFAQ
jgi:hypothetical protein